MKKTETNVADVDGCVKEFLSKMDKNEDSKISEVEFVVGAKMSPNILKYLQSTP